MNKKSGLRINLGCGRVGFQEPPWVNFDFDQHSPGISSADLTSRLPLSDESAELIYSSHLIEHFNQRTFKLFLAECYRVLRPGGLLRIVTLDFEEIASCYLANLNSGDVELAQVEMLLLVDQFARESAGGEYRKLVQDLKSKSDAKAKLVSEYIYQRTGEHPLFGKNNFVKSELLIHGNFRRSDYLKKKLKKIKRRINAKIFEILSKFIPSPWRDSNVLRTQPGEKHLWIYDYYTLQEALYGALFSNPKKMTFKSTNFYDSSIVDLDIDINLHPRKGYQSMYVEAFK